ncbi:MAG: hypothetical protein A2170_02085 [Deltaproteobacteria bacterium RBG_13_53_10]|nr:MAG: hypothetical protein A2170_02085 [Deltaproteobacteria bacterium RBG_13_53_10]
MSGFDDNNRKESTKKITREGAGIVFALRIPVDSVYRPNDFIARSSNPARLEIKRGSPQEPPPCLRYNKLVFRMQQFFTVL